MVRVGAGSRNGTIARLPPALDSLSIAISGISVTPNPPRTICNSVVKLLARKSSNSCAPREWQIAKA